MLKDNDNTSKFKESGMCVFFDDKSVQLGILLMIIVFKIKNN